MDSCKVQQARSVARFKKAFISCKPLSWRTEKWGEEREIDQVRILVRVLLRKMVRGEKEKVALKSKLSRKKSVSAS